MLVVVLPIVWRWVEFIALVHPVQKDEFTAITSNAFSPISTAGRLL